MLQAGSPGISAICNQIGAIMKSTAMEKTEFREDESQIESDEDIGPLDQASFSSAVLGSSDWTTETIISQMLRGNIQLNPEFQRRDAWDKARKSKFIESLMLGLPIPQIVLAASMEQRGSYIVLDGKQRLLSIRQFAAKDDDPDYEQLKLAHLEIRKDLSGYSLESLREKPEKYDDLTAFENQPIRTVVIKNWPNEDLLYHIFLRLNTGSVPLSPQELRQALHPGPFVSFLDRESTKSQSMREIFKISKPDFRMRDAELLLRFLAYKNYLPDYTGSLKNFLDNTCKQLNAEWDEKAETIREQLVELENAHAAVKSIFSTNSYRKWTGGEYETRFNRSVFDVMALSMSDPDVRVAAVGREVEIENAFKESCITNADFRRSIEITTKSVGATHKRFSIWNEKLNGILGKILHVPALIDGRIV